MADSKLMSSLSLTAEELKEKFLECGICFEVYNEDNRHPRLLPCLHTYCYQCVLKIIRNDVIECPQCRSIHKLKSTDITSFPKDNTRRDLMAFVNVKKSPRQIICNACNEKVANARCKECAEFLCNVCADAHKRTNMTKGHELIMMADLQKSQTLGDFCHRQMCPFHPEKILELYCAKDSCLKPICMKCAFVSCKEYQGHIIQNADDVAKCKREEIRDRMTKLTHTRNEVTQVSKLVQEEISSVMNLEQAVSLEINASFDNAIEILNRKRKELIMKVKALTNNKVKVLEQQNEGLEFFTNQMDEAWKFSDQALAHTNSPAFLQIEKTILARLNGLIDQRFDRAPHESAIFGFTQRGIAVEIQRNVNEKTNVWNVPVYPPKTQISQPREIFVNQMARFSLGFYDYEGKFLRGDDGFMKAIRVTIIEPSGKETEYETGKRGSEGDGLSVSFVPFIPGEHILDVRVLDKVIGREVFTVQANTTSAVSKVNRCLSKNVQRLEFVLNGSKAHKDVTVSPDGKTFLNTPSKKKHDTSTQGRLQKYKGTYGTSAINQDGSFYYEFNVRCKVQKPLEKCNLVFEIGIARKTSIDAKHHVEGQPYAWSMIGAHHNECDAICLHIAHDNKSLFHQMLTKNTPGSTFDVTFGFLVDTDKREWKIFNAEEGKQFCVLENIDTSEPLLPVVAGYNPYQAEVVMTLITASE